MPRPTKTQVPPPPGHVWIEDAARLMSVTVSTLYNYRQQGKGPVGVPSPRRLAYRITDIEAHLAERAQAAMTPDAERVHESRPPEPRISRHPARAAA